VCPILVSGSRHRPAATVAELIGGIQTLSTFSDTSCISAYLAPFFASAYGDWKLNCIATLEDGL
jgi:hypothetical protein